MMDVINFIVNAENLRTLFLFVAMLVGLASLGWWLNKKMNGLEERQDKKLNGLALSLRQDMNGMAATLRQEMDERFKGVDERFGLFHKTLKEVDFPQLTENIKVLIRADIADFHTLLKTNDFAHLNETIKALTFTLQKNKILEPEDKRFVDSHLEGG